MKKSLTAKLSLLKKLQFVFISTFLFTVFTGCKNQVDSPETSEVTISIKCKDKKVLELYNNVRSATVSLPAQIFYTVNANYIEDSAKYPPEKTSITAYIPFEGETTAYTLELGTGNWSFYIEGFENEGDGTTDEEKGKNRKNPILQSYDKHITSCNGGRYDITIPVGFIEKHSGSVNLPIDVSATSLEKLVISGTDSILDDDYEVSEGKILIKKDNIPSGTYNATLSFYTSNALLYKVIETINIKDYLVTSTWESSGASEYLIPQKETTTKSDFILTPEIILKNKNNKLYVKGDGGILKGTASDNDENTGSFTKPFATLQTAINSVVAIRAEKEKYKEYLQSHPESKLEDFDDNDYTIYIDGSINANASTSTENKAEITSSKSLNLEIKPYTSYDIATKSTLKAPESEIIGNFAINSGITTIISDITMDNLESSSTISLNNCIINGNIKADNGDAESAITTTLSGCTVNSSNGTNKEIEVTGGSFVIKDNSTVNFDIATVSNCNIQFQNNNSNASLINLKNFKINNGQLIVNASKVSGDNLEVTDSSKIESNNSNINYANEISVISNDTTNPTPIYFTPGIYAKLITGAFNIENADLKITNTSFDISNNFSIINTPVSITGTGSGSTQTQISFGKLDISNTNTSGEPISAVLDNCRIYSGSLYNDISTSKINLTIKNCTPALRNVSCTNSTVSLLENNNFTTSEVSLNACTTEIKAETAANSKTFTAKENFTVSGGSLTFENIKIQSASNVTTKVTTPFTLNNCTVNYNNSPITGNINVNGTAKVTLKDSPLTNTVKESGAIVLAPTASLILSGNSPVTGPAYNSDDLTSYIKPDCVNLAYNNEDKTKGVLKLHNPEYTNSKTFVKINSQYPVKNDVVLVLVDDDENITSFDSSYNKDDSRILLSTAGYFLAYEEKTVNDVAATVGVIKESVVGIDVITPENNKLKVAFSIDDTTRNYSTKKIGSSSFDYLSITPEEAESSEIKAIITDNDNNTVGYSDINLSLYNEQTAVETTQVGINGIKIGSNNKLTYLLRVSFVYENITYSDTYTVIVENAPQSLQNGD